MRYSFALIVFMLSVTHAIQAKGDTIYAIGNSLTWDTIPTTYATDWHVFCGKNLQYIYDNPLDHCVATSTPWTQAFPNNDYDFVIVQPHYGTTLAQDVAVISEWMGAESNAKFIIHTGWAFHYRHHTEYTAGHSDTMTHSSEYFQDLKQELQILHPDMEIRINPAIEVLELIYQDIQNSVAPFSALSDLYRDQIHMSWGSAGAGRYLMKNLMLTTLGKPISAEGFEDVPGNIKDYLNDCIYQVTAVPEPSPIAIIGGLTMVIGTRARQRRKPC